MCLTSASAKRRQRKAEKGREDVLEHAEQDWRTELPVQFESCLHQDLSMSQRSLPVES